MRISSIVLLVCLAGFAAAKPLQISFPPPPVVVPSPSPPPPVIPGPPPVTFQSPALDFSILIPGYSINSWGTAQSNSLCNAITSGWNTGIASAVCNVGAVNTFNGTYGVVVNGIAYFAFSAPPGVVDIQAATGARDARIAALTSNPAFLSNVFPGAKPNCACNYLNVVNAPSTSPFAYTTNLTGIGGPVQCGARLIYDPSNANNVINLVGVDDGTFNPANLYKYCSNPPLNGGVLGTPGSGSCRQYGVIASASSTTQATATASTFFGSITSITVNNPGSGYASPPNVVISAPSPVEAQVVYQVNNLGQPSPPTIVNSLNGPYVNPPTVTNLIGTCIDTSNPSGNLPAPNYCTGTVSGIIAGGIVRTGATCNPGDLAPAVLSGLGTGAVVSGLTWPNGGASIYCAQVPVITLSTASLQKPVNAVANAQISGGSVTSFNVIVPGSGYLSPPTITISAPTSNDLGKLCGPAPIFGLPNGFTNPVPIAVGSQCAPLGRDTYANQVCSIPAAPNGLYETPNAFTCNVISSFIPQPGSQTTSACAILPQSVTSVIKYPSPPPAAVPSPPPSPVPSPSPSPSPSPIPSPPPAPAPSCVYQGTYKIASIGIRGKYLTYDIGCKNTDVTLTAAAPDWTLDALATIGDDDGAPDTFNGPDASAQVATSCPTKQLAAANSGKAVISGPAWVNRIIPNSIRNNDCNTVYIQAATGNKYNNNYLAASPTGLKWVPKSSSNSLKWKLVKIG